MGVVAKDVAPVRKVIHWYALTSANDFPQRDPRDWQLLGSNDRGKTWSTLDVRKGEVFAGRQQRSVYRVSNPSSYEMYRLQIDEVRDASAANSIQLAELELMELSKDDHGPTPIFSDEISSRGENPPGETVANLFDGRIETKWLDWLTNNPRRGSWIQWRYESRGSSTITNIRQLLDLHAGTASGFEVRLPAVVAQPAAEGGAWLIDHTGWIQLADIPELSAMATGQKIILTGAVGWSGQRVRITNARAQASGAAPQPEPIRISAKQVLCLEDDLGWVEAEGQVKSVCATQNDYSFELQDDGWEVRVHFPRQVDATRIPREGAKVSVRGIVEGAFNESAQWDAAEIWVPNIDWMKPITAPEVVRGTAPQPLPAKHAASSSEVLTSVQQIRELTEKEMGARPRVKIRGIITEPHAEFMQDETSGIRLIFPVEDLRRQGSFSRCVQVDGAAELDANGNPVISVDALTILGPGKLPRPHRVSLNQLMSGHIDAQWIEVEGIVRSTDGAHLLLICDGQELMATLYRTPNAAVNEWVDGEVRARGVGVAARDDRGRIQGIHLIIPSQEDLAITQRPAEIARLPVRKIGTLLGLNGPRQYLHRIKVEGVVTSEEGGKFFLQDETGAAMAIFKQDVVLDAHFGGSLWLYRRTPSVPLERTPGEKLEPGDHIQVVGFPETHRYAPVLTEVEVSKVGSADRITPVPLTRAGIEYGGLDCTLVTLDGIVRGENTIGTTKVLALEWQGRTLQVLTPGSQDHFPPIALGSLLRVTGVCQVDPPPYTELGLGVGSVWVQTRDLNDLAVLARPSWWTLQRALMFMGGMAFVILAALIWIFGLRHQVKQRTAQLAAEIRLREQTEHNRALELERTRIAKDLHDDLGANLTQIVFLSERVDHASQDGQDAARWFNLIPATARRTIQSLDEIVWAVNPKHDSLESLANYMSQFAQEFLNLARVRCVLDVPTVLPPVPLSAEIRHNLLLATREALQNAVTHAAATEIRLSLKLEKGILNIAIIDNGKGFDPAAVQSSSNGLQNMTRRLASIGGSLEIKTERGKGTTILLSIPENVLPVRVIGGNGVLGQQS